MRYAPPPAASCRAASAWPAPRLPVRGLLQLALIGLAVGRQLQLAGIIAGDQCVEALLLGLVPGLEFRKHLAPQPSLDPGREREIALGRDVQGLQRDLPAQAVFEKGDQARLVFVFEDMCDRAIAFSTEKSDTTTVAEHGIDNASEWMGLPVPEVYSSELSEFVFAAGVKLLKEWKPDVMYLSTTDFIQHKFAPNEQGALDFYEMFDRYLGQLDALAGGSNPGRLFYLGELEGPLEADCN